MGNCPQAGGWVSETTCGGEKRGPVGAGGRGTCEAGGRRAADLLTLKLRGLLRKPRPANRHSASDARPAPSGFASSLRAGTVSGERGGDPGAGAASLPLPALRTGGPERVGETSPSLPSTSPWALVL